MALVKICGNTNLEDVQLAARLGADFLGLIFSESKRKLDITTAKGIVAAMPGFQNFVGVFVNMPKQEVETIANTVGLKWLQFHGDETALYCQSFLDKGFKVIKAFRVKDALSLKRIDEYDVTAFLLDTYSKDSAGGTGIPFDWNLLTDRPFLHDKLFLAGGLNPDNLAEAIRRINPYAVDVASGVEKSPGKKDPELLEKFIRIAKEGPKSDVKTRPLHS